MFEKDEYPYFFKNSLHNLSRSHSLRCDSKQIETRFRDLDALLNIGESFYLNELLPSALIKGSQPSYIEGEGGIPVINTLSIQNMQINLQDCRYILEEDFENLPDAKKLKRGDVLLTLDGGVSIGKPVVFDLDGDYTIDSHIAILRPSGISSKALVYLLASPIGQIQFQRFESGASGQTSVTEEDIRRFRFPKSILENIERCGEIIDSKRLKLNQFKQEMLKKEQEMWDEFSLRILGS